MSKYKVGDKVLIKKWDDMVEEFGLNKYNSINVEMSFTSDMKQFCNKIYEIVGVFHDYAYKIKEDKDSSYLFIDDMIERKVNDMTKNDLRSGMIIETRDGERYITIVKEDGNINFMNLNRSLHIQGKNINEEMENVIINSCDIMKIYKMNDTLEECKTTKNLIWERKEKKEMTIAEIEKELGYSIKIIKED